MHIHFKKFIIPYLQKKLKILFKYLVGFAQLHAQQRCLRAQKKSDFVFDKML